MIKRRAFVALAVVAIAAWSVQMRTAAAAAAPSVTLSKSTVAPGERIILTLDNWPLKANVIISTCGNAARRGSVDCNLTNSLGVGLSKFDDDHLTEFVVYAPPTTCPCVIQVATSSQSLFAYAPLEIVGHPTGAVVGNQIDPPLALDVSVGRVSDGFLGNIRSWIGGRTSYVVTVNLRNRIGEDLHDIRLRGRAGRSRTDQARTISLPAVAVLKPGATWGHTERVVLSAPVYGTFVWTVSASGAGPVAKAVTTKSHLPWLLYLLLIVLVADIAWYAKRRVWKQHGSELDERATTKEMIERDAQSSLEPEPDPQPALAPVSYAEAILARPIKSGQRVPGGE